MSRQYTFWKLIENTPVVIPIIQRDYAQGRASAKDIRESFLTTLYAHLTMQKPLSLDFVYGSFEQGRFMALDGQQRLTTLFLLHWYLAMKEGVLLPHQHILSRFTYETRVSSREFCKSLVHAGINTVALLPADGGKSNALSKTIKNAAWFFLSWEKDPTIKAMMTMLDAIHEKFQLADPLLDLLIHDNGLIGFEFIELENFGLSDNLYIKMNARGKALTEFESFKAKFEQLLAKGDIIHQTNNRSRFSISVDGRWTDFFWHHRDDFRIDAHFMRYVNFITEMLYHRQAGKWEHKLEYRLNIPDIKFSLIEEIYAQQANIEFLFDTLDLLFNIKDTDAFFKNIFRENDQQQSGVALFDGPVDLFDRCIKNTAFTIKERLLLYGILNYQLTLSQEDVSIGLKDFVRLIRNLIFKVRQLNKTVFNPNLRFEDIGKFIHDVDNLTKKNEDCYTILSAGYKFKGFTTELTDTEITKANLILANPERKFAIHNVEDLSILRGFIHNLDIEHNLEKLESYALAIRNIWSTANDFKIVRAMLTVIDDFALYIGWSALGDKWFFGNTDKWPTILTIKDSRLMKGLPLFLDSYLATPESDASQRLQYMIDKWLVQYQLRDWLFYFIKYPTMLSNKNNVFAFRRDESNFEIRNLKGDSLHGYHINPYVRTVANLINDPSVCDVKDCYGWDSFEGGLVLKNGLTLFCREKGWQLQLPENSRINKQTASDYLMDESGEYWLLDNPGQDRVQVAIDFIIHNHQLIQTSVDFVQ